MSVRLFKSLLYKASQLRRLIDEEQRSRWSDRFRLLRLKKMHLALLDRIQRLSSEDLGIPALKRKKVRLNKSQPHTA